MNDQKSSTQELGSLLEQNIDEIASLWAEKTYQNAHHRPSDQWLDILHVSTALGLKAMIEALTTGSYVALKTYLYDLCIGCLRGGFENGETTESLLLCKDAILTIIRRYSFDAEAVWTINVSLDACLRWMAGYFNSLYTTEMNQRLKKQHEHMASMLKMAEKEPSSVDINAVLRHVAEGIMSAVEVDHCDFYLMDDCQDRLIPKTGISRFPLPPAAVQQFLDCPPDLTRDVFYRELMERKEPLVCANAQTDSRVDRTTIERSGAKSVLAVPLVANDRVLAVAVTGTFHDYRTFTEEQIELAWDIARAATLVIENMRLNQQNRHMAALEERERLAREIHDNLAQALSILKLQASNIDDLLRCDKNEQARSFLAEMKNTATEAHADAREAIFSLRNGASSASEFLPSLRSYLDKYHRLYAMATHLEIPDEASFVLPTSVVTQLIRVVQEALANVRKHAQASAVWVRMAQHDGQLFVTIEDNGRGFDVNAVLNEDCAGVGLHIMRERAESLGGQLQVEAQPGAGTRILAQIPLSDRR